MNRLRELREDKQMSQAELAAILNTSQGSLSNWERGIHDIGVASLNAIADYFNVTVDYVLRRQDAKPSNEEKNCVNKIALDELDIALIDESRSMTAFQKNKLRKIAKIIKE